MQSKPIKILMITESFRIGGKERRLLELLKGFLQFSWIKCEIVMFKDLIQYEEILNLPYKIHTIKRVVKKDLSAFSKLSKIINDFDPDIVHAWGGMAAVYSLPLAKLKGVKTINAMITNSSPVILFKENWNRSRLTFPFSDIILSNSWAGIKAYGANKRKFKVIYNGFANSRLEKLIDSQEIMSRFSIKTEKIVGMVGALENRKDHLSYINAAILLLKKRTDVTFLVIGDGPNFESCSEMVPKELSDKILFLGNQKNVESLVNIFTIGVLTTNQKVHGEGISNSIMEYMALSKPVVATRGGGTSEIVEDGINGYLVPEFSVDALVEKISLLLESEELVKKIGEKGKETIQNKFSVEQMVQNTIDLYKNMLNSK